MKKPLTRRKAEWIKKSKPEMVRGSPINPNYAIEARYYAQLMKMIDRMTAETEKRLIAFFKGETAEEYFAMDASVAVQAKVLGNKLFSKFDESFRDQAGPTAETFAWSSDKASSAQVHKSLFELSGGLSLPTANLDGQIKDILSATITENVNLIKSIPQKYLEQVNNAVLRSITTGRGLQDLVPYLKEQRGVTERRAKMIAMDQTRKAMNNLSRARVINLGVTEYEWLHTGGSAHPREYHKNVLNGNVYSYTDPNNMARNENGEPILPGEEINCRCRQRPVIRFED